MKWTLLLNRMRFMLTGTPLTELEVVFGWVLVMHANLWHLSIRHGAAFDSFPFLSFFGAGELVRCSSCFVLMLVVTLVATIAFALCVTVARCFGHLVLRELFPLFTFVSL